MFRKMRRFKQELTREECVEILKNEPRGVLSLIGDDGYPYGLPMTHYYNADNGKIYFHCARVGHKIDALTACDKASFFVMDKGYRKDGKWALNIKSVIVFGRIKPVRDRDFTLNMCAALAAKFTDDEGYALYETGRFADTVLCLELTPEHISGKLVNES